LCGQTAGLLGTIAAMRVRTNAVCRIVRACMLMLVLMFDRNNKANIVLLITVIQKKISRTCISRIGLDKSYPVNFKEIF
jgi:hypothetical protein